MKRTIAVVVVALALHEVIARVLDRADLIERLLAPGPDALVALPFAALLYTLRFFLLFVAPAIVGIAAIGVRRGSS